MCGDAWIAGRALAGVTKEKRFEQWSKKAGFNEVKGLELEPNYEEQNQPNSAHSIGNA
jgi:hypothetical protein